MTLETRTLKRKPEIRAGDTGKTVGGYAAVFNSEADIGGWFREKIAPGAFKDAISADVRALHSHDQARVIGRKSAGTLRMSEDATGLAVEIDLPDTTDGRDLAVSIQRGDISGMSFGFRVTKEEWDETVTPPLRTIMAVELDEVSVVAFPAYEDTSIAMRSLEATFPDDDAKVQRLSLIDERGERYVRMAHLACVGSHAINGVAAPLEGAAAEGAQKDGGEGGGLQQRVGGHVCGHAEGQGDGLQRHGWHTAAVRRRAASRSASPPEEGEESGE